MTGVKPVNAISGGEAVRPKRAYKVRARSQD